MYSKFSLNRQMIEPEKIGYWISNFSDVDKHKSPKHPKSKPENRKNLIFKLTSKKPDLFFVVGI